MYLCVLSSTPDDPNDKPYDPSAHMYGLKWKHHPVDPKNVEKQIRDLMDEGVDVFATPVLAAEFAGRAIFQPACVIREVQVLAGALLHLVGVEVIIEVDAIHVVAFQDIQHHAERMRLHASG